MNITEKFLERLKPAKERQTFRDDEQTGFGIRVEPGSSGGRKSFFYNAKVGGQVVFKSIGEWPTTSVKDARDEAKELAGKASAWKKAGCPEGANPFAKPKWERTTVPTFGELTTAYIERHLMDPEVGALNKERAKYDCELLIKNYFESWHDMPIDKVTPEHVLAAKNAAKGRYIQNSVVEFARRVFAWSAGKRNGAVNFWPLPGNPAKDIALNKPEKRKRFLQPDELLRFNEELKKESHANTRDVLTLLLASGARKSNVYAMRWKEISFELANWHVPMSKSGESYEVPLSPVAMEVLERRRREIPLDQQFVFPAVSETGHIDDIKKRWFEFRKRAGIPDVRLHDLRRTKGSYAALAGESLQKIGAVLGHKSTGSTEIYARLMEESARKTSLASDEAMQRMMAEAKKRLKRANRKTKSPKLLAVANG